MGATGIQEAIVSDYDYTIYSSNVLI
jgi:hypothetical protein